MTSSTTKSAYWRGLRAGGPFVIVVIPFAVLFGVVATEAGLPLSQVMAFSFLVIAGASQFAALQFMSENAPVIIVLVSALAINLRMAMYSAAITPHLGEASRGRRALIAYFLVDQTYSLSANEFETHPEMPLNQKLAYFFGTATSICPLWYGCTWLGAVIGETIPAEFGLDFIVPITFLSIVGPALRTPAHVAAAFVSAFLALCLWWVPFNMGLLAAAVVAMAVGAEIERRQA
ncbi:MAG: AzlC family ABC transporter permease [Litoreibacter sp.]